MNDFPLFDESDFIKARRQFHLIAQIIGACRKALVKPIAKNDNLWLSVTEGGFGTPPIDLYNELEIGCNPEKQIIEIANNKDAYESISFTGKSRTEICNELSDALKGFNVDAEIDLSEFHSDKAFNITENHAKDFHTQLVNYNTLLREFHKGIPFSPGVKTPICMWPHHFDNAFKWFSGKRINEEDEFMGIGISNGDELFELPYIYMTFYPPLKKTNTLEISDGTILYDREWTGLVLPYDTIIEKKTIDAQKKVIEDYFTTSFKSIARGFTKR